MAFRRLVEGSQGSEEMRKRCECGLECWWLVAASHDQDEGGCWSAFLGQLVFSDQWTVLARAERSLHVVLSGLGSRSVRESLTQQARIVGWMGSKGRGRSKQD